MCAAANVAAVNGDGIDGGQKDCSNSGGVSRLCMYSSAAHISLRQGLHHFQQVVGDIAVGIPGVVEDRFIQVLASS